MREADMAQEKPNGAKQAVTMQNGSAKDGFVLNYNLLALAMGFVPDQIWQNVYNDDVALARGTIFADLDKPFIGEEAVQCD